MLNIFKYARGQEISNSEIVKGVKELIIFIILSIYFT